MLTMIKAPSTPLQIQTPTSANLLSVSVESWHHSGGAQEEDEHYIVATGADKRLSLFHAARDYQVVSSLSGLSDSPILSIASVRQGRYQLATNMGGQLLLMKDSQVLDWRKDHMKYAIKVVTYEDDDEHLWIATAGWDAKVLVYQSKISPASSTPTIGDPVGTIKLATNPESILFARNPDTGTLTLLVSRRDSTFIYFYALPNASSSSTECTEIGKQNLTPHSNAWVAFSPSCMALSPRDPSLLAVALSTLPHMKLMIVRLLFPKPDDQSSSSSGGGEGEGEGGEKAETQLSQAMAALAVQNREDAAIVIQCNTFAPQTTYSTPQVVWRPDGSGLWVNGDDGVIRGIEAKTGKVVAVLKDGHEPGSKVRSIWAGWVQCDGKTEEWLVSGGFDKRLVVWKTQ